MKQISVWYLNDTEFDEMVRRIYNVDFCFAADQEAGNDSHHFFYNIGQPLDGYDKAQLAKFTNITKSKYASEDFMARCLLNDLVHNSHLPAGNYLISVCW
jgi:hypothetical protein